MSRDVPLSPHQHVTSDMIKMLADRNWFPESEDDYSAVNDLVRFLTTGAAPVGNPLSIQDRLSVLIAKTRPAALPEQILQQRNEPSMDDRAPFEQNVLLASQLPEILAKHGWAAMSENDHAALEALQNFIIKTRANIDLHTMIDEFIAQTRPATSSSFSIDEKLAEQLAVRGWMPVTEADVSALDALKSEIFETRIFVEPVLGFEEILTQFISKNTPPA